MSGTANAGYAKRSLLLRNRGHKRMQGVSEMYRGRLSMTSGIFAGCPSLGHLSWARKKGDKASASPCQEVRDPCSFSAPQFTGPRRHAVILPVLTLFCCRSASPRHRTYARPPAPSVDEPVASAYECAARIQAMPRVACSCEIAAINECRACLPSLVG
jgi:hypothetical protein